VLTENKIKTKTDTTIALALPRRRGRAAVGLRGFTDVNLWPGEMKYVSIMLSRYDLSI